jgi:hypothetical protein
MVLGARHQASVAGIECGRRGGMAFIFISFFFLLPLVAHSANLRFKSFRINYGKKAARQPKIKSSMLTIIIKNVNQLATNPRRPKRHCVRAHDAMLSLGRAQFIDIPNILNYT